MQQIQSASAEPGSLIERARAFITRLASKKLSKKNKLPMEGLSEEPVLTRAEALQVAAVEAFNALLDDEEFYIKHQKHITVPEKGPTFSARESLAASGLLTRDDAGTWRLARRPRDSESEDLRWFNVALLSGMYPVILTKNQQRDYKMLMFIPLLIIACYLLKGIADFGQSYLIGSAGNLAIMNLRSDLYRHIQGMSLAFFSRVTTGEIISRISNDVSLLRRGLSSLIIGLSRNIFMVIALSAVIVYQNWQMAILCLIVLPAFSYPIIKFGSKARKYSVKTQVQMAGVATFLDETISGNQTVKSYCM
jgi:ABC-type multidrug transport system fused ATPase/permease subunit